MSERQQDLARLLGLVGPGVRLLFVLFVLTFTTLALTSGGTAGWSEILALVIACAAAALLASPGAYPASRVWVAVVLGAVVLVTVLSFVYLPQAEPPTYASWNFGATTFLLFGLALRGQIRWAWIGMLAVVVLVCLWSAAVTGSAWLGFLLIYGQVGSLVAGTLFAVLFNSTARRIVVFQRIEHQRVAEDLLRQESERELVEQLERVRLRVNGPLRAIAAGETTADDLENFRLLEGSLRDDIRGTRLQAEPLASAVRVARARGCDVTLLDDGHGGSLGTPLPTAILEWAAKVLGRSGAGSVTVRLRDEKGLLVASVVQDGGPALTMTVPGA